MPSKTAEITTNTYGSMHGVIISQKMMNIMQKDENATGGNHSKTLTNVSECHERSHRDHRINDIHTPGFEQETHELIQLPVE